MKSMTGYAALEQETGGAQFAIEIRGYNSRYLDMAVSLPPALLPFETDLRALAASHCQRGKIEISVRVKEKNSGGFVINRQALDTYIRLCAELVTSGAPNLLVKKEISPLDLLYCEGVLQPEAGTAASLLWDDLRPLLDTAFERFTAERGREGAHTEANIMAFVAELDAAVKRIAVCIPEVETLIKTNIRKRLEELNAAGIDENRILAETAILLMKCTIAEEVSRLEGHLAEFRSQARREVSLGKKLDFLCQEIAREINTIGAKTPLFAVSALIVSMKESVENIREQLRNIE